MGAMFNSLNRVFMLFHIFIFILFFILESRIVNVDDVTTLFGQVSTNFQKIKIIPGISLRLCGHECNRRLRCKSLHFQTSGGICYLGSNRASASDTDRKAGYVLVFGFHPGVSTRSKNNCQCIKNDRRWNLRNSTLSILHMIQLEWFNILVHFSYDIKSKTHCISIWYQLISIITTRARIFIISLFAYLSSKPPWNFNCNSYDISNISVVKINVLYLQQQHHLQCGPNLYCNKFEACVSNSHCETTGK